MSIFCDLGGHRASAQTIFNGGHRFARCTRCNADLVERDGAWTSAPKGFRIVWKSAETEPLELTEVATPPAEETQQPVAEERRGVDRRAPAGAQPKFTGVDRRKGDRRASFGKKPFAARMQRPASVAEA